MGLTNIFGIHNLNLKYVALQRIYKRGKEIAVFSLASVLGAEKPVANSYELIPFKMLYLVGDFILQLCSLCSTFSRLNWHLYRIVVMWIYHFLCIYSIII